MECLPYPGMAANGTGKYAAKFSPCYSTVIRPVDGSQINWGPAGLNDLVTRDALASRQRAYTGKIALPARKAIPSRNNFFSFRIGYMDFHEI